MFTWIQIYAELAKKILPYRDRQDKLINILQEMKTKGLPVISIVDRHQPDKSRKVMKNVTKTSAF
jgi:hypothetical protein